MAAPMKWRCSRQRRANRHGQCLPLPMSTSLDAFWRNAEGSPNRHYNPTAISFLSPHFAVLSTLQAFSRKVRELKVGRETTEQDDQKLPQFGFFLHLSLLLPLDFFKEEVQEEREKEREAAMAPVPASVAKQAEQLRIDGNTFFKKDRIGAAIDAYTEAITLCPNVTVYWTNRALCYRKRNEWMKVEEDCKKALELDSNSVKALDLGRGANPVSYMVEEIWLVLAKAKYMEWENESSERTWRLQSLKEECEKALTEHYLLDASQANDDSEEAAAAYSEQLHYVAEVFDLAGQSDKPTEVPDYLCCKITLDIFRDPVITPSGITYERAVLLDHLQRVGRFDPVTRVPLEPQQLVPNLAIKEAVQAFLKDHGWAYRTG